MGCLKLTYYAEPELRVSYLKKELTLKNSAEKERSYLKARYYAPWLCRFVSVDPMAEKYAHLSPYNYASNNPATHTDVDGMQNPKEQTSPQVGGDGKKVGGSKGGSGKKGIANN